VVTDVLSDLLFVTEPVGLRFLKKEGVPSSRVHLVGDVMIDTLRVSLPKAREAAVARELGISGQYAILTMHRPANVDDPERLARLLDIVESASKLVPVVFPVHPRTRKRLDDTGLHARLADDRVKVIEPQGYLRFLSLLDGASLAITDSGGVPEECTYLGIPCITLRNTTERPLTIQHGVNTLVDANHKKAITAVKKALARKGKRIAAPKNWDGRTAERIVKVVERFLVAREKGARSGRRKAAA
jgi:UDP-N-acetylglucosamine 2-epimerase (non-hydrolysing)